jgi:transposase-like protein
MLMAAPALKGRAFITRQEVFIRGKFSNLYRAVDKHGETVDFLLRPDRGIAAARWWEASSLS